MRDRQRQIAVVVLSIAQLITNAFGGIGINGVAVGDISDSYRNFFTPAGYTFSVWAAIYLGLTAYAIYQALPKQLSREVHRKVGWWAASAAAANTLWTPLFIFRQIEVSLLVMVWLLVSLVMVFIQLRALRGTFTNADHWAVQIPFYGYFAWITVATVANVTVLLQEWNWNAFDIAGSTWSMAMIGVATLIAGSIIFFNRATAGILAYLAVLVWAFAGVYVGNSAQSTAVGITAIVAAVLLIALTVVRFVLKPLAPDETQPQIRQRATQ